MSRDLHYDEPFFWWGPGWESRSETHIGDLLRDGTLDARNGAVLWAALSRRKSLVVIAGPSGAGKTTLLTALLDFLPPDTKRIYPRGCFETFTFLSDRLVLPNDTVLLVNEISPHLPIYHWGDTVGRLLDAVDRGFAVLATAHATTVPEFIAMLTGSPLRIAAQRVAAFDFVVVLEASGMSQSDRRVSGIWRLMKTRDGVMLELVAAPSQHDISPGAHPPVHDPKGHTVHLQELLTRRRVLDELREGRLDHLPVIKLLSALDDPDDADCPDLAP